MRNIFLIGFMGSGKSTVGKALAKEIGYDFIDIDSFIEESTKMSIPDIFAKAGEAWFRDQETFAVSCLAEGKDRVIATGGGVVEREENIEIMKKNDGFVVYLKATPDKLWTRVGKDPNRPLSTDLATFRKRFDARKPKYETAADLVIDTDGKTVEKIMSIIKEYL